MFTAADFDEEVIEVWPENWPAVDFFLSLTTQWRHGMGGPTGLDYPAVLVLLRRLRLPRAQADEMFEVVRVMERAALNEIHRKR